MRSISQRLLLAMLTVALSTPLVASQGVVFVDSTRPGGRGTYEQPYATIREATRAAGAGFAIYVAEAPTPYDESVTLRKGQMLVGSAYGLDAVRTELHVDAAGPALPAMKGTGPLIHGSIYLAGDNVVAGCTLVADRKSGTAMVASSPQGPLTFRALSVRTVENAAALDLENSDSPTTWTGGAIDAAAGGAGIIVAGGNGAVTLDHVPVTGAFSTALAVRRRSGGTVVFRNGSAIHISDSSGDAITIDSSKGSVRFDSPLQIRTRGGRGIAAREAGEIKVTDRSWIESIGAAAVDIRGAAVDIHFEHISAASEESRRLSEGVILDRIHGVFEVNGEEGKPGSGGVIRNPLSYGIRVTQSSNITLRNLSIDGGGTVDSGDDCPPDLVKQTNVRCRAAVYLRHVEHSSFENLTIQSNAGVGVNGNNLSDVKFVSVRVSQTGDGANEPALLLDEVRGALAFNRCQFLDGRGGAVLIAQQFNSGRVTFDGCEMAASGSPTAAPVLFRVTALNSGSIAVALTNSRVHDNAGSGVRVDASANSSAALTVRDSYLTALGETGIGITATGKAQATLIASGNHIVASGNSVTALLDVRLSGGSGACVDLTANQLSGGAAPTIRIGAATPQSQVRIAGVPSADDLSARNGGVGVSIDAKAISAAKSCD